MEVTEKIWKVMIDLYIMPTGVGVSLSTACEKMLTAAGQTIEEKGSKNAPKKQWLCAVGA